MSVGDTGAGDGSPGLRASLARLATAGVGLLSTRAELLSVEFVEERERLTLRLALVAAAGLMLAFSLLFAGAFVIAVFWETHRLAAIAAVAVVHLGAGLFLLSRSRAIGRDGPRPFAASLEELKRDRAALENALGEHRD